MEPDALFLTLPSPFNTLQGSDDPRYTAQSVFTLPNAPTQERPGEQRDTPPKQQVRATQDTEEEKMDVNLEDSGLPSWNDKNLRVGVKQ